MKVLENITEIDTTKLQELLEQSPCASPFQTYQFYDFYNSLSNASADVFVVDDDGNYRASVVVTLQHEQGVKSYFSRRGIVYGGLVLLDVNDPESASLLLSHLEDYYKRKLIYLEIRNNFDYSGIKQVALSSGFEYIPWLNYQFHNFTIEGFESSMAKTRQRQLKKAIHNGVTWREVKGEKDVHDFYSILSVLYKHKVKKPLPPVEFFLSLIASGIATCLVVVKGEKILGGVMCPLYFRKSLYELYICGMDKDYPLCHPSIVAMWAMVEYASQKGIKCIDLMGAGQANKPSTVRDFKAKFGGKLVENGRYLKVYAPNLYTLGRFYLKYISIYL